MKLKYYMRGLGIGILITTIILSLGSKKEKLNDTEIMAKARELGMVLNEENTDSNLEEVLEKSLEKEPIPEDSGEDTEADAPGPSDEDREAEDLGPSDLDREAEDLGPSDVDIEADAPGPSDEDIEADAPGPSDEDIEADVPGPSDEVTFTIVRGMSSRQVSELIADKGLVDDAVDFDDYIKQQGKASVIRIGTYTLAKNSDYQTILNSFTE